MFVQKFFRRGFISMGLGMMILLTTTSPTPSLQAQPAHYTAAESVASKEKREISEPVSSPRKNVSTKDVDLTPSLPSRKIETEKITSIFVQANDSKRIQFSILVACKREFTQAVRELFGENVTPLLFSVSTLPLRNVIFDPSRLRFEQRGRIWQPDSSRQALDVWPLVEGDRFGGPITDGQIQQGVILLPEWFDPQAPITVRYGDFHYLARFAQE
ncbi:MAG: hypothetical protein ONB46_19815 [candidate division KSB1 bacterium]|nr:hypothetical protein [candidate division KSB1 bacterium]MDZ7368126.1 hypothetical protein [candidate division KSB1 bacterium]MDZ7405804.1 hypothetical protein [candidate division KSB1 bacterium]